MGAAHFRTNPVQVGYDKKLNTSTGSVNVARPPKPVKILDLDLSEINPIEKQTRMSQMSARKSVKIDENCSAAGVSKNVYIEGYIYHLVICYIAMENPHF